MKVRLSIRGWRIIALLALAAGILFYYRSYFFFDVYIDITRAGPGPFSVGAVLLSFGAAVALTWGLLYLGRLKRHGWTALLMLAVLAAPPVYTGAELFANGATAPDPGFSLALHEAFTALHREAVAGGTAVTVDFRKMSGDRPWERMLIFGPYSSGEQVNKALGFQWTKEDFFTSHERDYRILFVQGDRVVGELGFDGLIRSAPSEYKPGEAVFELTNKPDPYGAGDHPTMFELSPARTGETS
ncbi:hypothetical protein J2T17_001250 [Paenibacillus mucilaginosus]|uniref:hypothetical protein n=1 Tax=Paenibacillus mucilaginosus TaxID=61624 RepID=UPI003D1CCAFA